MSSIAERASVLDRLAGAVEERRKDLRALLRNEAGLPASIAAIEVPAAARFCRHFATLGRTLFGEKLERFEPCGSIVCVSGADSLLAVFVAQIAAAYVAGNDVIVVPEDGALGVQSFAT